MQHAPPDVRVNQQRAVPAVGKCVRQVRRDERLAVAGPGTRDRHQQRGPAAVGVYEIQAHAAQGLHDFVDVVGDAGAAAPAAPRQVAEMRDRAEDWDPESARDLVGIADLGVDPIEHDGAAQPQRQAGGESQEHDARRRVPHRILRHNRVIQDARVRYRALLGQARLVVILLQAGEEVLRERHLALQPGLVDGARRYRLQRPRVRRHAAPQLRLPPGELGPKLARQRRDRLPLQRGDLAQSPLHRRVLVGILVAQRPQLRLLRGQLVERLFELHVLLHRPDDRERFRRQP